MPSQPGLAAEMPVRGKRGKPKTGFPLSPPPLEIALRFPHSHRLDKVRSFPDRPTRNRDRILERSPYFASASFRLIFRLENALSTRLFTSL